MKMFRPLWFAAWLSEFYISLRWCVVLILSDSFLQHLAIIIVLILALTLCNSLFNKRPHSAFPIKSAETCGVKTRVTSYSSIDPQLLFLK